MKKILSALIVSMLAVAPIYAQDTQADEAEQATSEKEFQAKKKCFTEDFNMLYVKTGITSWAKGYQPTVALGYQFTSIDAKHIFATVGFSLSYVNCTEDGMNIHYAAANLLDLEIGIPFRINPNICIKAYAATDLITFNFWGRGKTDGEWKNILSGTDMDPYGGAWNLSGALLEKPRGGVKVYIQDKWVAGAEYGWDRTPRNGYMHGPSVLFGYRF